MFEENFGEKKKKKKWSQLVQNITKYNKEIKQSQWDTPGITKPTVKLNNTNTKKKRNYFKIQHISSASHTMQFL